LFGELRIKKFDIIFFDPPFNKEYISILIPKIIDRFTKKGTLIYIENRTSDEKYNFDALEIIKETVSGESNGKLYRVSL
jgi:16S rRNA G966 N2-methylase RsmD